MLANTLNWPLDSLSTEWIDASCQYDHDCAPLRSYRVNDNNDSVQKVENYRVDFPAANSLSSLATKRNLRLTPLEIESDSSLYYGFKDNSPKLDDISFSESMEVAIATTLVDMRESNTLDENSNLQCVDLHEIKFEIDFHDIFDTEYLRNNKSKSVKNLRCFPKCCQDGTRHVQQGFCGSSINCSLKIHQFPDDISTLAENIIAVGALCCVDNEAIEELDSRMMTFVIEFINNRVDIIKGRDEGIYIGNSKQTFADSHGIHIIEYEFNSHPKNWPYNYTNHRFKASNEHSFYVYTYLPTAEGIQPLDRFQSPLFGLASKRRGHTKEHRMRQSSISETSSMISHHSDTTTETVDGGASIYCQLMNADDLIKIPKILTLESGIDESSDDDDPILIHNPSMQSLCLLDPENDRYKVPVVEEETPRLKKLSKAPSPTKSIGGINSPLQTSGERRKILTARNTAALSKAAAMKERIENNEKTTPGNKSWLPSPWASRSIAHSFKFEELLLPFQSDSPMASIHDKGFEVKEKEIFKLIDETQHFPIPVSMPNSSRRKTSDCEFNRDDHYSSPKKSKQSPCMDSSGSNRFAQNSLAAGNVANISQHLRDAIGDLERLKQQLQKQLESLS